MSLSFLIQYLCWQLKMYEFHAQLYLAETVLECTELLKVSACIYESIEDADTFAVSLNANAGKISNLLTELVANDTTRTMVNLLNLV